MLWQYCLTPIYLLLTKRLSQLNLVSKARSRAALRAAAQAANYKGRKWQPNRLRFRGKSLGLFTVDNPIRWGAIYICTHGLDELALLLIFVNTVMLIFYDPHDIAEYNPNSVRRQVAIVKLLSVRSMLAARWHPRHAYVGIAGH
jgi:hypothetical protein